MGRMKSKASRSRLGSPGRSDTFEGRGGQKDGLKAALRKARPPGNPKPRLPVRGVLCWAGVASP